MCRAPQLFGSLLLEHTRSQKFVPNTECVLFQSLEMVNG